MRLAWFAPMPRPDGRAAADLSIAAVPHLAAAHEIEIFAASADQARAWAGSSVPVRDAYDFVWRQHQRPYDLVVYQLSNEPRHDYAWGYLWNYPGLAVLQDVHLHHARARILLEGRELRSAHYASELEFNHAVPPGVGGSLAAFTGPTLHVWPMRRTVVAGSRLVAVHGEALAAELAHEDPSADIACVTPGVADPGPHPALRQSPAVQRLRERLSLPSDAIVLVMFGPFTLARRTSEVIRALAALCESDRRLYLLLAGPLTAECDPLDEARGAGVLAHVRSLGAVAEPDLATVLGAADLAVCLRWPTAGETAAEWLTCLACGLPTVITDFAHNADLPVLDPRTWAVQHGGQAAYGPEPVAVIVDLLDEAETLRLALRRLSADGTLRERIGRAGRNWWSIHHTPEAMARDYEDAIARAARRPVPAARLPRHLRPDAFAHTRALLDEMGAAFPAELEPAPGSPRTAASRT